MHIVTVTSSDYKAAMSSYARDDNCDIFKCYKTQTVAELHIYVVKKSNYSSNFRIFTFFFSLKTTQKAHLYCASNNHYSQWLSLAVIHISHLFFYSTRANRSQSEHHAGLNKISVIQ